MGPRYAGRGIGLAAISFRTKRRQPSMGPRHAGRGIAHPGIHHGVLLRFLQWVRATRGAVSVMGAHEGYISTHPSMGPRHAGRGIAKADKVNMNCCGTFNGSAPRGARYRPPGAIDAQLSAGLQWVRATR